MRQTRVKFRDHKGAGVAGYRGRVRLSLSLTGGDGRAIRQADGY